MTNDFPIGTVVKGKFVEMKGQKIKSKKSPYNGLIVSKLEGYSIRVE